MKEVDVIEALRRYHKVSAIERQRYFFSKKFEERYNFPNYKNPVSKLITERTTVRRELVLGKSIINHE